ncbi:hypothetical protein M413DRAFT_13923 [Hebeloma cylindrosporum]|uniref:Uncharacterized protein n=1 Tax=Hebeloma cylindrosporum TaxID=76867 RepID=A0A0C3BWD6_HEBCY|nr:hypothetical protein M413DRAFT_13923 [Hebeloma cylindrosporum h7]
MSLLSAEFLEEAVDKDATTSWDFAGDAAATYTPDPHADPHAVSKAEVEFYYAGLHSAPTLLYRTGKEQWFPPRGPEAYRRLKELREVFNHSITKVWNHDLGWKVVEIMDAHMIRFTTIDVVRFKKVKVDEPLEDGKYTEGDLDEDEDTEDAEGEEKSKKRKPETCPVTIWIGVFPESTSATAAHDAAQAVLVLLKVYHITHEDVDFRESFYTREVGPRLHKPVDTVNPLRDVVGPLTPALGLSLSTKSRPDAQGTMALYIAEGGGSDRLLGLSCHHVLIDSRRSPLI